MTKEITRIPNENSKEKKIVSIGSVIVSLIAAGIIFRKNIPFIKIRNLIIKPKNIEELEKRQSQEISSAKNAFEKIKEKFIHSNPKLSKIEQDVYIRKYRIKEWNPKMIELFKKHKEQKVSFIEKLKSKKEI